METSEVLAEIRRIVEEEWAANSRPVLLSNLPRALDLALDSEYRSALGDKSLKVFLQDHADDAEVQLVQDPVHRARVGIIPADKEYAFPAVPESSALVTGDDARTFGRVLGTMTADEQRVTLLPASFVARLLAAK